MAESKATFAQKSTHGMLFVVVLALGSYYFLEDGGSLEIDAASRIHRIIMYSKYCKAYN